MDRPKVVPQCPSFCTGYSWRREAAPRLLPLMVIKEVGFVSIPKRKERINLVCTKMKPILVPFEPSDTSDTNDTSICE